MSTNPRSHARAGLTLALALLFLSNPLAAEKVRPAGWAVPVRLEGVPNLHRITPDLYRSSQPTLEGFENLKTLGIRTVVNLRGGDDDARASIEVGFRPEHIALSALRVTPSANVRILRVLGESGRGPTLFHCRRGAERAGMICALYRMVFQGWDREKAIEEMRKGGYGFRWYYRGLINYLRDVDVEALRKEIGITPVAGAGATPGCGDVGRCPGRPKSLEFGTLFGAHRLVDTADLVGEQGG